MPSVTLPSAISNSCASKLTPSSVRLPVPLFVTLPSPPRVFVPPRTMSEAVSIVTLPTVMSSSTVTVAAAASIAPWKTALPPAANGVLPVTPSVVHAATAVDHTASAALSAA